MDEITIRGRGHPDPTADEAIANVMRERRAERRRFRPLVYICSPYAGDTDRNVYLARRHCRFAVTEGYIPIASHLHYPQFLDDADPAQRELGLSFALALLGKCDELWAFGVASEGMSREIGKAKRRGMKIRYFDSNHEEVTPHGNQTKQDHGRPDQF
jgi:hypothetical protein